VGRPRSISTRSGIAATFPVIKELGYEPVRADQDTGSLIVGQMLERLYLPISCWRT